MGIGNLFICSNYMIFFIINLSKLRCNNCNFEGEVVLNFYLVVFVVLYSININEF